MARWFLAGDPKVRTLLEQNKDAVSVNYLHMLLMKVHHDEESKRQTNTRSDGVVALLHQNGRFEAAGCFAETAQLMRTWTTWTTTRTR